MLILDNHIVSPVLIETALRNELPIYYKNDERPFLVDDSAKILTNSESCLPLLDSQNPNHPHTMSSKLVKNKAMFRELLSSNNKSYYFSLVTLENLLNMTNEEIPYPVVIKPNKGYSSVGVYIVKNKTEWDAAVNSLYTDLLLSKGVYSNSVIDGEDIIIEQWIDGEEYAIDCYINKDGEPVVLNILQRIFTDEHDTSDRIYFTSAAVMKEVRDEVTDYLTKLNEQLNVKNYPFHLEVRRSKNGILPIELNPLRFAGAGTTDVSLHAYGINGAESYFLDLEPKWNEILKKMDDSIYGFFCAEIPIHISKSLIRSIDHASLKNEFSEILEYREINAANDRTFAVVFFKAANMAKVIHLLNLDLTPYITLLPSKEKIT